MRRRREACGWWPQPLGVLDRLAVSYDAHDSHMALKNEEGKVVSEQINTICRYLASVGDRGEQLLGSTPETQAQVGCQSCSRRLTHALVTTRSLYQCCQPFACSFVCSRQLHTNGVHGNDNIFMASALAKKLLIAPTPTAPWDYTGVRVAVVPAL